MEQAHHVYVTAHSKPIEVWSAGCWLLKQLQYEKLHWGHLVWYCSAWVEFPVVILELEVWVWGLTYTKIGQCLGHQPPFTIKGSGSTLKGSVSVGVTTLLSGLVLGSVALRINSWNINSVNIVWLLHWYTDYVIPHLLELNSNKHLLEH